MNKATGDGWDGQDLEKTSLLAELERQQRQIDSLEQDRETLLEEVLVQQRKIAFIEAVLGELPNPLYVKDESGRFFFFNKAYEEFFGVVGKDLLQKTSMDLAFLPEDEREISQIEDEEVIRFGNESHRETQVTTFNGLFQVLCWTKGISAPSSGERGLVGEWVDITRRKQLELDLDNKIIELKAAREELLRLSRTDALTGLPNRRPFEEHLGIAMAGANRHGDSTCLLMTDLDFFKKVNDTYGHDQGDSVLKAYARVLDTQRRQEDVAARIGGEEFALLLPRTSLPNACVVAERLNKAVRALQVLPQGKRITVSIGIAQYKQGESAECFFKRADAALYEAKNNGRDRFVCAP